jgi:hypothetical protein
MIREVRMSALGQKQTFAMQKGMSALLPTADMCGETGDVRYGPIADIRLSFDHLIGLGKERWRHDNAQRLGGP